MDLTRLTAAELAEKIHSREVSAVEVAQAHLDRIAAVDGTVHAFLHVAAEAALAVGGPGGRARSTPAPRPRRRWPACRWRSRTSSPRSTCPPPAGSKILEGWRPPYDATVTARLRAAGITILGKTNMDEFAMGSSTENSAYGPTRNPWDTARIPGGSGGGSAAALAAFEAPLAIGTDTGGSIRQPAAITGTVGVKPTYGGVSRYGLIACASSLDQGGPCARTVLDAALLHEVIGGYDPLDSTSIDAPVPPVVEAARAGASGDLAGLRVGVVRELGGEGYQPGVERAYRGAVERLEKLGAEVVEVSCPHFEYGLAAYYLILPSEVSSNLARFDAMRYGLRVDATVPLPRRSWRSPARPGSAPEVKRRIILGTYALSSGYYDAYYGQAQKVRTLIARDFAARVRAGRRAGLARPRRPRRSRSARRWTTRWPCTSTTSRRSRRTWPASPAMRVPCGLADGGRAAGRAADHGPGAGRGADVPGRRGLRGRARRRRRRPADPAGADLEVLAMSASRR